MSAVSNINLAILIPLLPILGWAILGLWGKQFGRKTAGSIATSLVGGSFLIGLIIAHSTIGAEFPIRVVYGQWFALPGFQIPFGIQIDQLSLFMVLIVTGVSALIHLYSIGYMSNDPGYARYFSYLNLFVGMMTILVLADNFLLMFVGWEGVGLCSYLLIGFWFERPKAVLACKKAFLVNRVGDAGFLLALILLATSPLAIGPDGTRTLTYQVVFGNLMSMFQGDRSEFIGLLPTVSAIALLLFIGATGKSASIPLHVWLPDAMEGPTPVSALIHAATMVTAGIYLLARAHAIYLFAPVIMAVIVVVAALTALFAATVALVQTDIKRALAYSTISQIAFMFLGAGVGAFAAAMFHLMTHAFFKACLFLGAGSVIKGTGEQNVRHLGGLKKWMPATRWTFLLSAATLAGFPLLSGFFSKDTILHEGFVLPFAFGWNIFGGIVGYLTAIITAFYSYRLYYLIFEGEYKGVTDRVPRDPGLAMMLPLWILAVLSVVAGLAGIPLGNINLVQNFLGPVFEAGRTASLQFWGMREIASQPWLYMLASVLTFAGGWWAARHIFLMHPEMAVRLRMKFKPIYGVLWNKYGFDDLYQHILVKPGIWLFGVLWRSFDEDIIDNKLVDGTGRATSDLANVARPFQNGYLRTYALYMLLGIVVLIWLASS